MYTFKLQRGSSVSAKASVANHTTFAQQRYSWGCCPRGLLEHQIYWPWPWTLWHL